ncbi:MAG: universal stress protein [Parvularculaceae bacterium]|nr:universal stress protein [Parvularculaceae bacterium]
MAFNNVFVPAVDAPNIRGSVEDALAILNGTGQFIRVHHVNDGYEPPISLIGAVEVAAIVDAQRQSVQRVEANMRQAFREGIDGLRDDLEAVFTSEEGELHRSMPKAARSFDVVAFRHRGSGQAATDIGFIESLLFKTGRPLFLTPQEGAAGPVESVAVAWNGSREAARAAAAATPLTQSAKSITVLTVGDTDNGRPTAEDLAAQYQRAGKDAQVVRLEKTARTSDLLVKAAKDKGCDVMVLGAFSQSRLREAVLGGVTRKMLTAPPMPLLLTH